MITLVLGGVRSGKSAVAERLAEQAPTPITYVATGRADDADMARRIAAHRDRRPATWHTREAGPDLPDVLWDVDGTALVDALGTWVAGFADLKVDPTPLCAALTGRRGDTIVVSEEVGLGVHAPTLVGRQFTDTLGTLNQAVAEVADTVLLVIAGRILPLARPG